MPSCLSQCLRAQDLRLLQAAIHIARVTLAQIDPTDLPGQRAMLKAQNLIRQAEAIATTEMQKNNLVPALSATELRDELLPDEEIPAF